METHGFELIRDEHIEELNTQAKLYRHIETGAEFLSMENDDENKVFGITFRTPPKDSTGIAHIMEHSVLCGSKKYPLKEPFIELVKGSLKTFLNAMTYPDKTTYPVASQNEQDFYNLVDVYLDAVLNPLIPKETLEQEGWHYELDEEGGDIQFKGVVFNEMKGVYSSPDSLLYRGTQQTLFPDNTYGVDSGGNPVNIPDLTYEQFKSFHETYYHPSNARIYFYGDDNPARRLELLETYLKGYTRLELDSSIQLQAALAAPQQAKEYYEAGEGDTSKKSMMTLSWLLPENTDHEQSMLLGILSYMLVGTPASPLRKALMDSGLGEELTGGGLAGHLRQMYFSTGLKGIAEDDAGQVEQIILTTLAQLAQEGFDPDLIEAALNMTEFHLRENNTGSYPRGLSLMIDVLSTWLHGHDPIEAARYEGPLQKTKQVLTSADQNTYISAPLQTLIQEHFLDNTHRVSFVLAPKEGVQKQQEEEELQRLQNAQKGMDEQALKDVLEHTQYLKKLQATPDAPEVLAKLPSLQLSDLDRQGKNIPIAVEEHDDAEILYHDLFTNQVIYLDIGFDLSTLKKEWLPYLSLFGKALVEIGTETEDEVQIAQRIRRKTGGIWPSSMLTKHVDSDAPIAKLFLRGKVAADKMDDLLDILHDLLLHVRLDNQKKFSQMVRRAKANVEASMIPSGHSVVNTRLSAKFSRISQLSEYMGGIHKLMFLRELAERVETDWEGVLTTLEAIRSHLINRSTALCNVTADSATWAHFKPKLKQFISALPHGEIRRQEWNFDSNLNHEGLIIPAQVNYVGKGANLYDLGYTYHASVSVITKFLRTSWLWEKVRVQGGAYGGMCQFSRRTGTFTFLSYRDPNILATLDAYDQSSTFLSKIELSDHELTRNIIGTIGDIDGYQLPDSKGYTSMMRHITGESDVFRQQLREEVLSTTAEHFRSFGDVLKTFNEQALVVVLGSKEALEEASQQQALELLKIL